MRTCEGPLRIVININKALRANNTLFIMKILRANNADI